jgi:hypothetical protein
MLRKLIVAIASFITIGGAVALSSTEASAQWRGGWGWRGGGIGIGRVGGWGWRGGVGVVGVGGWGWRRPGWGWGGPGWGWGGPGWGWGGGGVVVVSVSCWRWVPTVWGPARVWIC